LRHQLSKPGNTLIHAEDEDFGSFISGDEKENDEDDNK